MEPPAPFPLFLCTGTKNMSKCILFSLNQSTSPRQHSTDHLLSIWEPPKGVAAGAEALPVEQRGRQKIWSKEKDFDSPRETPSGSSHLSGWPWKAMYLPTPHLFSVKCQPYKFKMNRGWRSYFGSTTPPRVPPHSRGCSPKKITPPPR